MSICYKRTQFAHLDQKIVTREIGAGKRRVAFVAYEDPEVLCFVRDFSKVKFKEFVFYRVNGGSRAVGLVREAVFRVYGEFPPYREVLEFPDCRVIELSALLPNQEATSTPAPRVPRWRRDNDLYASACHAPKLSKERIADQTRFLLDLEWRVPIFSHCHGSFCRLPYRKDSGRETAHGWFCDDCVHEVQNLGDPVL